MIWYPSTFHTWPGSLSKHTENPFHHSCDASSQHFLQDSIIIILIIFILILHETCCHWYQCELPCNLHPHPQLKHGRVMVAAPLLCSAQHVHGPRRFCFKHSCTC